RRTRCPTIVDQGPATGGRPRAGPGTRPLTSVPKAQPAYWDVVCSGSDGLFGMPAEFGQIALLDSPADSNKSSRSTVDSFLFSLCRAVLSFTIRNCFVSNQ